MGFEICDKHAKESPDKIALIDISSKGQLINYSFSDLQTFTNKLANVLISGSVKEGERVAIFLPQSVETGISHIATWKIGAISIPLSTLFGEDALRFRLTDSLAKVLITDLEQYNRVESLLVTLPFLEKIFI